MIAFTLQHCDDAPEVTRCRACEGTGMVQCDTCRLLDADCDACGEPAEVLVGDEKLPLCYACNRPINKGDQPMPLSSLPGFIGGGPVKK